MGTYALRRAAAEGVTVCALEHEDGSASIARDVRGRLIAFDPRGSPGRLDARVGELLAAVADVKSGALARDGLMESDHSDLRVLVGGHSYGCPTAMLACQRAPRGTFAGAILHDPAITAESQAASGGCGPHVRAQYVLGEGYAASKRISEGVARALATSAAGSEALRLRGAEHGNFVDAPLWTRWRWVMRSLPLIPAAGAVCAEDAHAAMAQGVAALARGEKSALAGGQQARELFVPLRTAQS